MSAVVVFFEIPQSAPGRLFIGPRPQADFVERWAMEAKGLGVERVVCLMLDGEMEAKGIGREKPVLATHGIAFTHFPIHDFGTPDTPVARDGYADLITEITDQLAVGTSIMIHCSGGVGRAGTTCSCVLVAQGTSPDDAMQTVSTARVRRVPETDDQIAFVRAFSPER